MTLQQFLDEFGLKEADLGTVTRMGRRCFLTQPGQQELIVKFKRDIFGAGVYLGEEQRRFEPSPALLELIAAKTDGHKAVVDAKAAWLFLCGRDLMPEAVSSQGEPTQSGFILVQNERDENLGYGAVLEAARQSRREQYRTRGFSIKNLLDRGFFLRRERLE